MRRISFHMRRQKKPIPRGSCNVRYQVCGTVDTPWRYRLMKPPWTRRNTGVMSAHSRSEMTRGLVDDEASRLSRAPDEGHILLQRASCG